MFSSLNLMTIMAKRHRQKQLEINAAPLQSLLLSAITGKGRKKTRGNTVQAMGNSGKKVTFPAPLPESNEAVWSSDGLSYFFFLCTGVKYERTGRSSSPSRPCICTFIYLFLSWSMEWLWCCPVVLYYNCSASNINNSWNNCVRVDFFLLVLLFFSCKVNE